MRTDRGVRVVMVRDTRRPPHNGCTGTTLVEYITSLCSVRLTFVSDLLSYPSDGSQR